MACLVVYGLFQVPLSKITQHQQQQKKNHTKNPWTWHCPNKATIPTLSAVSAFWCLCLSFLHPQKSSKWQENLEALWAHTGYWGSCSSPARLVTGTIAPPSDHQHSCDCSGILLPLHHYQDTLQICSLRQKLQPGKADLASLKCSRSSLQQLP